MKKQFMMRVTAILLMICMVAGMAFAVGAAYPKHTDYVYDGAQVLPDSVKDNIKSTNDALYAKVKAKIAVCVVESLGDESIDAYAKGIFEAWEPGECVLLLVSIGENDYYAVQSMRVASVLNNEQLDDIMHNFMEADFVAGNVGLAIQKTVNKLSSTLKAGLAEVDDKTGSTTADAEGEQEKVTFGGVILSLLKIVGWAVLIVVFAFIAFFVAALFNDTAADLMNRYVFSHFTGNKPNGRRENYYDERFYQGQSYGNPRTQSPQQRPRQGQPPRQQGGQAPRRNIPQSGNPGAGYDRYRQGGVRYEDEYYGPSRTNGTQRPRNTQGGGQAKAPRQQTYQDDGFTRQFSMNELNRKN